MTETRISHISYEENYKISILLQNGHKIVYNMKPKLITARFRDLTDWTVFFSGKITQSGKLIHWNDHTEISLEEIMFRKNTVKHTF